MYCSLQIMRYLNTISSSYNGNGNRETIKLIIALAMTVIVDVISDESNG